MRTLPMAYKGHHQNYMKSTSQIRMDGRENAIYFWTHTQKKKEEQAERAIYGIAIIDESCAHFHVGEMSCW